MVSPAIAACVGRPRIVGQCYDSCPHARPMATYGPFETQQTLSGVAVSKFIEMRVDRGSGQQAWSSGRKQVLRLRINPEFYMRRNAENLAFFVFFLLSFLSGNSKSALLSIRSPLFGFQARSWNGRPSSSLLRLAPHCGT